VNTREKDADAQKRAFAHVKEMNAVEMLTV